MRRTNICAICSKPICNPDSEVDPNIRRCFCDALETVVVDSPESLASESDYTISSTSDEGSYTSSSGTVEDSTSPESSDASVTRLKDEQNRNSGFNKNNDDVNVGASCSYDVNDVNVGASCSYEEKNTENLYNACSQPLPSSRTSLPSLRTKAAASYTLPVNTRKRVPSNKCINLDISQAQKSINASDEHVVPTDEPLTHPLGSQALANKKLGINVCNISPNKQFKKVSETQQLIENIKVRTNLALAAAALKNVDSNEVRRHSKENKENIPSSRPRRSFAHRSIYDPKKNYKQILEDFEYFHRLQAQMSLNQTQNANEPQIEDPYEQEERARHQVILNRRILLNQTQNANQAQIEGPSEQKERAQHQAILNRQRALTRAQQEAIRVRQEDIRVRQEAILAQQKAVRARQESIRAQRDAIRTWRANRSRQPERIQQNMNQIKEQIFQSQSTILPRIKTRRKDIRSAIKRQLAEENLKKENLKKSDIVKKSSKSDDEQNNGKKT